MADKPFVEGTLVARWGRKLKRSKVSFPDAGTAQAVTKEERLALFHRHIVVARPDEVVVLDLRAGVLPPQVVGANKPGALGHLMVRFGIDGCGATRWVIDPTDRWGGPVFITRGDDPEPGGSDVGYDPETDSVFRRNRLLTRDVMAEEMLSYILSGQPAEPSRWIEEHYDRDTVVPPDAVLRWATQG